MCFEICRLNNNCEKSAFFWVNYYEYEIASKYFFYGRDSLQIVSNLICHIVFLTQIIEQRDDHRYLFIWVISNSVNKELE